MFVLEQTVPILEHTEDENLWRFRAFRVFLLLFWFFYVFKSAAACALSLTRPADPAPGSGKHIPGSRAERSRAAARPAERLRGSRSPLAGAPRPAGIGPLPFPGARNALRGCGGRWRWVPGPRRRGCFALPRPAPDLFN